MPKLNFMQIYADQMEYLAEYDDAQLGRLMRAAMAYAFDGTKPEFGKDNAERFVWPILRRAIDRCADGAEQVKAARSKAANARWARERDTEDAAQADNAAGNQDASACDDDVNASDTMQHDASDMQTDANACKSMQTDANACEDDANACKPCNKHTHTQTHIHTQTQKGGDQRACARAREARAAPQRMQKPSVEEVAAYCAERGNRIDAQQFVDFYASKGWRVGNAPMKDWRACVRTWEQRDTQRSTAAQARTSGKPPDHGNMQRHEYSAADYAGMVVDLDAD